jgi:hypothetical protein
MATDQVFADYFARALAEKIDALICGFRRLCR